MDRLPVGTIAALIGVQLGAPAAFATQHASPEQRTLAISRSLHPIPDEEWQNIAGDRATEGYAIIKGDTLYDISQRLFGDPKYWPKIWAINNRTILNPHLIYPGNAISFMAGTGSALPAVAVTAQADEGAPTPPGTDGPEPGDDPQTDYRPSVIGRSQDWRYLPHQRWEANVTVMPSGVDHLGFDMNSKVRFKPPGLTDLPSVATTERIDFKGRIFAAASEREYLFLGDTVYIQADQELSTGQTYAITKEPARLAAPHSDRPGYSYRVLGKVKIVAVRDKLYMGEVTALSDVIARGVSLMPFPERITEPALIPCEKALEGTMIYDEEVVGADHASQQRWVYIDRGTEDGVRAGMVFRHYQHDDSITGDRITDADVLPEADFEIIFATTHYSTARVMRSNQMIENGLSVSALSSLDDLKRFDALKMKDLFGSAPTEANLPTKSGKSSKTASAANPNSPTTSVPAAPPAEVPDLDQKTTPGSDLPPPTDISPGEAPLPEQNAPTEKSAPPAELAPIPEAAPPEQTAPMPAPDAGTNAGGNPENLPPPPEVAPMPDLPPTPDSPPVQDPNP